MDFMIWVTRSLHLFSNIVWIGGLLYQSVIITPGIVSDGEIDASKLLSLKKFVPFIWMSSCTALVTGIALMLFSPRFLFLEFSDRWSLLLGLKQLVFLLMMFFSFGFGRMIYRAIEAMETSQNALPYLQRSLQFSRLNVGLAIVAIVLAAGLE